MLLLSGSELPLRTCRKMDTNANVLSTLSNATLDSEGDISKCPEYIFPL